MKFFLVIVATWVVLTVLLFGVGPGSGFWLVSDEPVIGCGGLNPADCQHAFERDTARYERRHERIAYYKIEPVAPDHPCGDWSVEWYVATFGPFGWTERDSAQPLC